MKISKHYLIKLIHESLGRVISNNKKLDYFSNLDQSYINKGNYDFSKFRPDEKSDIVKSFIDAFVNIAVDFGKKTNISFVVIKMLKKPVSEEVSQFFNKDTGYKYTYNIRASYLRSELQKLRTANPKLASELSEYIISNYLKCNVRNQKTFPNQDVVVKIENLLRKSQQDIIKVNDTDMTNKESTTSIDNKNLDTIAERFIQDIVGLKFKFPHGSGKSLSHSFIHMHMIPGKLPSEEVSQFFNRDKPVPKKNYRIKGSGLQKVFRILLSQNNKELAISVSKFLLENYRHCKNNRPSNLLMTEAFEELKRLVDLYSEMYKGSLNA